MWEAAVWKFTIAGKSKQGNWYEERFPTQEEAVRAARHAAARCDAETPLGWWIDHGCGLEWTPNEVGIAWGVRLVAEGPGAMLLKEQA